VVLAVGLEVEGWRPGVGGFRFDPGVRLLGGEAYPRVPQLGRTNRTIVAGGQTQKAEDYHVPDDFAVSVQHKPHGGSVLQLEAAKGFLSAELSHWGPSP
jgi:hypothetical protein